MKRRDFLKTIAVGVAGAGLVPGEALAGYRSSRPPVLPPKLREDDLKLYLRKVRYFNANHKGDIFLDDNNFQLLESSVQRFKRLQRMIGFGNFYLLDFDDALRWTVSVSPSSIFWSKYFMSAPLCTVFTAKNR